MKLLTIELHNRRPFTDEQIKVLDRLSILITGTPGFVWKTFSRQRCRGVARGVYVFEDAYSAQLYSCRLALQMSALGVASIHSDIRAVGPDMYADAHGAGIDLLFSPQPAGWHNADLDDLVA